MIDGEAVRPLIEFGFSDLSFKLLAYAAHAVLFGQFCGIPVLINSVFAERCPQISGWVSGPPISLTLPALLRITGLNSHDLIR